MSYTAKTRFILKHNTEAHWNTKSSSIPLNGEVVIYEADDNNERPRIKIGDGVKTLADLPFLTPESVLRYDVEQKLTDKQKKIVWDNLGLQSGGGGSEETTTEVTFTYDGNIESDANKWVVNYTGYKIFVKAGEVPEGTINLVDGLVTAITPTNSWLNYSLTITEEKLEETVDKYGTAIPATQPGLIQYFYKAANDSTPQTIFMICTRPGWYNLAFDDWFETINIEETGIYFFDKRPYGGSTYVASLTFSVTTGGGGGGGTVVPGYESPVEYAGTEMTMFSRGICVGDSVTEGSFDSNEGGAVIQKFSYPKILQRLSGVEIVNAGIAGATSQTWYEASLDSTNQWGRWLNNQWVWNTNPEAGPNDTVSTALDYWGYEFAIIHMGINDLGFAEAQGLDAVLNNFETYMNNIIWSFKNANKGIRIFIATIIPSYAPKTNSYYQALNERIKTIVNYTEQCYLLDLNEYSDCAMEGEYNVIHPTALGYHKIASEVYSYISYIIHENLNEFRTVQFIGTDHTI